MIKNSFDSGKGKIHLRFSSVCVEVDFDFMEKPITDEKFMGENVVGITLCGGSWRRRLMRRLQTLSRMKQFSKRHQPLSGMRQRKLSNSATEIPADNSRLSMTYSAFV